MSEAYAVFQGGKILVDTVSSTARAAKVNYLVTECGCVVTAVMSDVNIQGLWRKFRDCAVVVPVTIAVVTEEVASS